MSKIVLFIVVSAICFQTTRLLYFVERKPTRKKDKEGSERQGDGITRGV